jgi:hypothetical protein
VRPERCWPLAVGVVRWIGTPRRRCGRGGEPELRAIMCRQPVLAITVKASSLPSSEQEPVAAIR